MLWKGLEPALEKRVAEKGGATHDALVHRPPQKRRGTDRRSDSRRPQKDLEAQQKHGVNYIRYWFNEEKGEVFCLVEAPSEEAAEAVHREAHGMVADEITEVKEGS